MKLIEQLKWRYATKKFSDRMVAPEKIDQLIEATSLSASSAGMQPYRLIVVSDKELQRQLGEGSFNSQIGDASHLLVFAAFDQLGDQHVDDYISHVARVRDIPEDTLADFRAAIKGGILNRPPEVNFNWAARQAYIALGTAIIAAAELQIDATPMEGFDPEKFDSLLGLKQKGLRSVVTLAVGYRDEERDAYSKLKKVRLDREDFARVLN